MAATAAARDAGAASFATSTAGPRAADDAALRAAAARGGGEWRRCWRRTGGSARPACSRTALFLAAAAGQNVERLLAAGADPTRQAHGGWKPSHFIPERFAARPDAARVAADECAGPAAADGRRDRCAASPARCW